jgi:H+/gluconate symporter-like permease
MKKTFLLAMAGVALAIVGAVTAMYFMLKLRQELDAATEENEALKNESRIQQLNQELNENAEIPKGAESAAESRP